MLLCVCADKGSPGATTTALVLAAASAEPATVVEADPYGGDTAIRLRVDGKAALPEAPTVLTLATAARTSTAPELVARYAHRLNRQVSVVPGQIAAEQTSGVPDWSPLAGAAAAASVSGGPVIVDVGRLHAASPVMPVAVVANVVVVVGRPDSASVIRLRERCCRLVPALAARRHAPPLLLPVLVSHRRHGPADAADLARVLEDSPAGPLVTGVGWLAHDPATVRRLEAGGDPTGRLARTPLMRSARAVTTLLTRLTTPAEAVPESEAVPS